jgi:hypothetical protein
MRQGPRRNPPATRSAKSAARPSDPSTPCRCIRRSRGQLRARRPAHFQSNARLGPLLRNRSPTRTWTWVVLPRRPLDCRRRRDDPATPGFIVSGLPFVDSGAGRRNRAGPAPCRHHCRRATIAPGIAPTSVRVRPPRQSADSMSESVASSAPAEIERVACRFVPTLVRRVSRSQAEPIEKRSDTRDPHPRRRTHDDASDGHRQSHQ